MVQKYKVALDHMRQALAILDSAGAPDDIGAHLDLAIVRTENAMNVAGRRPDKEAGGRPS